MLSTCKFWRRDADELHAARRKPEAFSDLFDRRVLEAGRDEGDERQRAGGVARPQHEPRRRCEIARAVVAKFKKFKARGR